MIYVASYKSVRPGIQGLINRLIMLLDRAEYSHNEICIGNPFEAEAECYSASGEDGGVRMKKMKLSPAKWDLILMQDATPEQVRDYYSKTKNSKYDYLGVGRFALPWLMREHSKRFFCSEWVLGALNVQETWRFSPQGCHMVCIASGGKEMF